MDLKSKCTFFAMGALAGATAVTLLMPYSSNLPEDRRPISEHPQKREMPLNESPKIYEIRLLAQTNSPSLIRVLADRQIAHRTFIEDKENKGIFYPVGDYLSNSIPLPVPNIPDSINR